VIDRRTLLGAIAVAPCLAGAAEPAPRLTLYSPAPPDNPMHALNRGFGDGLAPHLPVAPDVIAMPLPQSIHHIAPMEPARRAWHWPITTSADFLPARLGVGPDWHGYPRACPDLLFITALYEVGFGISVWDDKIRTAADLAGKRIAVPPRPSAVRLLAEALLFDGWGLGGQVTLVDRPPGGAVGGVDATAWNLVVPGSGGLLSAGLPPTARFLPVDRDALERIHATHAFRLRLVISSGTPLLSFAQALAAWAESDGATIGAVLDHVAARPDIPGFPQSLAAMRDWPALAEDAVHPTARDWYHRRASA
jgi:hypothetical protein